MKLEKERKTAVERTRKNAKIKKKHGRVRVRRKAYEKEGKGID